MTIAEEREYFRIEDLLPIEYRIIDEEEYLKLENTVKYSSTQIVDKMHEMHFLKEKITSDEAEKGHVQAYLQLINKKLDIVLDILSKSADNKLYVSRHAKVSISGAGIQFFSETPMHKGDLVELKVILPILPYPKITALCHAMRSNESGPGDLKGWNVALKFATINEGDRDLLINYIFMKERELLRSKKELAG